MFRMILPTLLVALGVLLDATILPMFFEHWLMPLFALVTVHCLGLLLGRTRGVLYGMIAGILIDISVSTPLGLMTLFYAALGYLGGWFGRKMYRNPLMPVIASLVCFALFELGMAIYATLATATVDSTLFVRAFLRLLADVAVTQVFYIVYDWLLKPSRSRFAPR